MKLKSHLIAYFTLVAVLPVHAVAADNASAEVTALVERLNQLEQELRDLRSQSRVN